MQEAPPEAAWDCHDSMWADAFKFDDEGGKKKKIRSPGDDKIIIINDTKLLWMLLRVKTYGEASH